MPGSQHKLLHFQRLTFHYTLLLQLPGSQHNPSLPKNTFHNSLHSNASGSQHNLLLPKLIFHNTLSVQMPGSEHKLSFPKFIFHNTNFYFHTLEFTTQGFYSSQNNAYISHQPKVPMPSSQHWSLSLKVYSGQKEQGSSSINSGAHTHSHASTHTHIHTHMHTATHTHTHTQTYIQLLFSIRSFVLSK